MQDNVRIFDTTLRDGEQSPGCSMRVESKVLIARQLARLGVDVIEAGFPIASAGDLKAVARITQGVKGPTICALARTRDEDIAAAAQALESAARQPRIHVFVATSDVHMESKLRKSQSEIFDMASRAVQQAKRYTDDVEFSPEDASRSGREFLLQIVVEAAQCGATTINIPDTVGYSVGDEYAWLIAEVLADLNMFPDVIISTHCHNDLAHAVSNTLAGISAGARQAECCVLGIGERAGNAQLEAVVMALKTRHDLFPEVTVDVNTQELGPTARLVATITGKPIPDTTPVVGANAFAHAAGIHQDGVMKDHRTYEIMRPETVGWKGESNPLTKHSGRHALLNRAQVLGYQFDGTIPEPLYGKFTELADTKTYVYNEDLHLLAQELLTEQGEDEQLIRIKDVEYHRVAGDNSARVVLLQQDQRSEAKGAGDGPKDAVLRAITRALKDLSIGVLQPESLGLQSLTSGKSTGGVEAVCIEAVCIKSNGEVAYGRGFDTDTIVAFAKAVVAAVNHLLRAPVPLEDVARGYTAKKATKAT